MKQSLGDRMKNNYEKAFNFYLPWRMPLIVRLDGKNFHSFTRAQKMKRPFDDTFIKNMQSLAEFLCEQVATTVFAYSQSDEISLLLHPYRKLDSEPFFRNEVQKIASVTAGLASAYFSNLYSYHPIETNMATFDARCFVLPEDEVNNYFVWRQQDASSNSVSMVAQSKFSHKELQNKGVKQMQEMMFKKDKTNWARLPVVKKRGFACYKKPDLGVINAPVKTIDVKGLGDVTLMRKVKTFPDWYIDTAIPIFSKHRSFVEKWLRVEES